MKTKLKDNEILLQVQFKNGKEVVYQSETTGIFRWDGPFGFTSDPAVEMVLDAYTGEILWDCSEYTGDYRKGQVIYNEENR